MRIGINRLHPLHCYIWREYTIEFISKAKTVDLLFGIKVGNHLQSMHTGISAPCTSHRHILTQERGKSLLEALLHRDTIGLYLPTMIVGPIV